MIDAVARTNLRSAVDEFLSDRIKSNEFDERLQKISESTADATVREVVLLLWFVYDDFENHAVILDKPGWDCIQRVLLALDSGAEFSLTNTPRRVFHPTQLIAIASLLLIPILLPVSPWLGWFVLGMVSISITLLRQRGQNKTSDELFPFRSLGQIRIALQRAPQFKKQRYRSKIGERHIRPFWVGLILSLPAYFAWCFVAPFILLYQCLPVKVDDPTQAVVTYDATAS